MTDTYDENKALLEKYRAGDENAAEEIIRANLGLVKSIAMRFIGRGQELEDLIQIGSLGMLKAIRGYDPSFGTVFSTYAVPLITGEIRRFLRDDGLVKISRSVKKNGYVLNKAREAFIQKNAREPKLTELSEICGISDEDALYALEASRPAISLQEKLGADSDAELMDVCAAKDEIDAATEKIALHSLINKLPDEEKRLIHLRYFKGLTQSEAAKLLGITQVKVSRMEKKIINKLRTDFL